MNRRSNTSSNHASVVAPKRARAESSGASTAKRSIGDRLNSYFAHHRASFRATFVRLSEAKIQTAMTSLVVAITLALPALLLIVLGNMQQLGKSWDAEPKLTLYVNERAKQAAIEGLISDLEDDLRVASLVYISADKALAEFEALSGFGAVLSGLESNPLPAAIEISLSPTYQNVTAQKSLAAEWQAHALIEQAVVDLQWVQRFIAITELARKLVVFLAMLLAVGALLAIGNTIRLIIENRKEEIVVIKLVGGTNGFVRRPLLYTGGAYGFIGAMLAIVLVNVVLIVAEPGVDALAQSYQSEFELRGLGFMPTLQLLLAGTLVGWLGAVFAVGRHLADIEPS